MPSADWRSEGRRQAAEAAGGELMELDPRHLALLKRHAGIVEARRVTAYECVRRTPNGHGHRVRVEIQEARPGVTPRYLVVASADGKVVYDNGNDDLGQAICGIPWHKLEPHDETG